MSQHLERVGHVEARIFERNRGNACFVDVETARPRLVEHARRQIDPLGRSRESGDPFQQQSRTDSALEDVGSRRVSLDELDLEIVDQRVVAARPIWTALGVILRREFVVISAGGFDMWAALVHR